MREARRRGSKRRRAPLGGLLPVEAEKARRARGRDPGRQRGRARAGAPAEEGLAEWLRGPECCALHAREELVVINHQKSPNRRAGPGIRGQRTKGEKGKKDASRAKATAVGAAE